MRGLVVCKCRCFLLPLVSVDRVELIKPALGIAAGVKLSNNLFINLSGKKF